MSYLRQVDDALALIREHGRYREIEPQEPRYAADFSTNDYLALAADSRMVEAMRHVKRVGAGGARLLGGRHREHWLLESDIARWLGRERALLFSSGYLAALGAIAVLSRFVGAIYSDTLNHACLIDGIRAAKLPREIFAHAQLPPRCERRGRSLIISETLFGMDGDTVDVAALAADLGDDDILLVDEAHALGVLGPEGAGLAHGVTDERVVILGTLGKAIGASGGFIAGPAGLIDLLVNAARTFVFDTAPPPAIAFAARVGIMLARTADERRMRLRAKTQRLRDGLHALGFPSERREIETPVVPIIVGDEQRAMDLMRQCKERGVYAPAVRPPTVPPGTSRLRVSMRADHTDEQVDLLLDALACLATS
jgi:8-amino-7-oxononanoate synthase